MANNEASLLEREAVSSLSLIKKIAKIAADGLTGSVFQLLQKNQGSSSSVSQARYSVH